MLARVLLCLLAATKVALCEWPFGSDFAYWLWQSCKGYRRPTQGLKPFSFKG
jgi:hypothetical protein